MDSCANCAHAVWQMTKHNPPRVNSAKVGRCACPPECREIKLPRAVMGPREAESYINSPRSGGIWHDSPHTDCPTWAPE